MVRHWESATQLPPEFTMRQYKVNYEKEIHGRENTHNSHTTGVSVGKVQISSPVKSNDVQWLSVNAHGSMAKDEAVTLSRLVARCSDEVI